MATVGSEGGRQGLKDGAGARTRKGWGGWVGDIGSRAGKAGHGLGWKERQRRTLPALIAAARNTSVAAGLSCCGGGAKQICRGWPPSRMCRPHLHPETGSPQGICPTFPALNRHNLLQCIPLFVPAHGSQHGSLYRTLPRLLLRFSAPPPPPPLLPTRELPPHVVETVHPYLQEGVQEFVHVRVSWVQHAVRL